jgi:hypothetical protein
VMCSSTKGIATNIEVGMHLTKFYMKSES